MMPLLAADQSKPVLSAASVAAGYGHENIAAQFVDGAAEGRRGLVDWADADRDARDRFALIVEAVNGISEDASSGLRAVTKYERPCRGIVGARGLAQDVLACIGRVRVGRRSLGARIIGGASSAAAPDCQDRQKQNRRLHGSLLAFAPLLMQPGAGSASAPTGHEAVGGLHGEGRTDGRDAQATRLFSGRVHG